MTARIAAIVLTAALTVGAPGNADNPHRARCHGDPRPRLGLGVIGGPWACRPAQGWYWPIPAGIFDIGSPAPRGGTPAGPAR